MTITKFKAGLMKWMMRANQITGHPIGQLLGGLKTLRGFGGKVRHRCDDFFSDVVHLLHLNGIPKRFKLRPLDQRLNLGGVFSVRCGIEGSDR